MNPPFIGRAWRWASRTPSVEIHIAIRPTPTSFNMVQCLALSVRRSGGICRDSPIVLTVGDDRIDPSIEARYPWLGPLGVELRRVPEPFFRQYPSYATGATRLAHDFRSDVVLLLDPAVLVARRLDGLIRGAHRRGHVAGMLAPASPLQFFDARVTWSDLYRHCEMDRPPDPRHEHPGWPHYHSEDRDHRYCPIYFNYGVICAPAEAIRKISEVYFPYILRLGQLTHNPIIAQVALAMAIEKLRLPTRLLPARYNFPNHPALEAMHAREVGRAKILNLKESHQFEEFGLFDDLANVRAAIRRDDLSGINELARRVLSKIEPDLVDSRPRAVAA
jgi:hypothetical protein